MCIKNVEATIKEAIESVIEQDYPHEFMEFIIVDGYSKDKSISIIKDCLSQVSIKNKIFYENEGLGNARQIVVDNASGDYIVWVDGDMVLSKDFVRRQVEFMEQNPHVGIAKGRYELSSGANLLSTLEIYSRAADKMEDYSSEKTRFKSLGTSGCIYRVKAIRQVGGFDKNIKGYGEDWDAEYRTRAAGWSLRTSPVYYRDYERLGVRWKELWHRYRRRGYDLHYFFQKYKGIIQVYRMLPFVAFLAGLLKSSALYGLTRQKLVFLLPFQYMFKMSAWWFGYIAHSVRVLAYLG
jgi:glycosyltransferase involved in cell wall biosynthesis